MARWFRVYDDLVDDPKVQRLPPDLFRALINLWCLTSHNGGMLPSTHDIAFRLRITTKKTQEILRQLAAAELIDEDENGLHPHNWNGRQFKSDGGSTERVRRYRNGKRNVSCNGDVTPPDTDTETETESEKKETRARRALRPDWPSDFAERFWQRYPNKIGKAAVFKKLDKLARDGPASFDELMAGLHRYVAKTDDRPWCNPLTWLNQQRWLDQPATVQSKASNHGRKTTGDVGREILAKLRAADGGTHDERRGGQGDGSPDVGLSDVLLLGRIHGDAG